MMQENRLSLQITWHYISLHLAWRTQRWRREKKDGRGLHKCHGWKLRLRMERQRNSTSHQNILPSTAPLLRNTRDAAVRTAWLTNCPLCRKCSCTNIYSMHHWNSSKTRDWRTRHNRWSGWREECGQSSLQMGAVCDYGQVVLSARFICLCAWDTPGHSSDFLSAPFGQPWRAEKTGGGVKNKVAPSG